MNDFEDVCCKCLPFAIILMMRKEKNHLIEFSRLIVSKNTGGSSCLRDFIIFNFVMHLHFTLHLQ